MRSKKCLDCGETKPASDFWRLKSSKDGLAYYCKVCFGLRNSRSYRKKQADLGKETRAYRRHSDVPEGMKYCPQCKEVKSVDEFGRNRASRSGLTHYCRPCHSKAVAEIRKRNHGSARNYLLKLRYSVTEEEVGRMMAAQGGVCVICLRAEPKHVDHSHLTGVVRGVLCFKCNGALGQFQDDPRQLGDAADYLEFRGPHAARMRLELGSAVVDGEARRCEAFTLWGTRAKFTGTPRQNHLRQKYGINDEDASWLLSVQGGMCAICWSAPAEHVDHDHRTGVVRGMACGGCNTGMGQLGDDAVSLRRAADYLLGELVRTVATPGGGRRLSLTVPDVDPTTVVGGGWESYREEDGRHRRMMWTVDEDHEGPTWLSRCLAKMQESYASLGEEATGFAVG
ncbi:endonuclease VII domain-containing protein [Actinomadura darangshiensis]|nr:endonuclease VII domain-containing protein [Actinomadura darangshiensis]